jgi:E3 ubiquitin-protein ligase MARCH6
LRVQRRDGSCELCKTKFRFSPQYADNTPDRLPPLQVFACICRRAIAKWLPLTLRTIFAASLWLIVAPLATSYLYHGWMARPSIILERFKLNLFVIDLVSGAVVAASVIVSFLSLMSFADFLRGQWQQQRGGAAALRNRRQDRNQPNDNVIQNERRNRNHNNNINNQNHVLQHDNKLPTDEANVDNGIWNIVQNQVLQQPNRVTNPRLRNLITLERELKDLSETDAQNPETIDNNDEIVAHPPRFSSQQLVGKRTINDGEEIDNRIDDNDFNVSDSSDDSDRLLRIVDAIDTDLVRFELDHENQQHAHRAGIDEDQLRPVEEGAHDGAMIRFGDIIEDRARNDDNPDNDLVPQGAEFDQDDAIDMDINIALDELFGVRGPLLVVARNLLWLLSFNAVFLGFFAFVPRTVGVAMSSIFINTTYTVSPNIPGNSTDEIMAYFNISGSFQLVNAWRAIDAESMRHNATLRLHDISTITLGYFSLAVAVILFRYLWVISQKVPFLRERPERTAIHHGEDIREVIDGVNRLVQDLANDIPNLDADQPAIVLSVAIGVGLDALLAVVKVAVLLFLKMFLLPVVLGLTLDASTIQLFGGNIQTRVSYAGKDLFSFILLHWVAGITFMLLVTVSVLQQREVVHPDLLAQIIRPQEPQPDLLGNLMHESVSTHAKRMVLSLVIYAFLLFIHIFVPIKLYLLLLGMDAPYLKLKLSFIITPQLQVPLELLAFHLCMLAMLEKYKNGLGGIQHHWLKYITKLVGLSDCILPKTVSRFRLIGSHAVFETDLSVHPFWFELSKSEEEGKCLLETSLANFTKHEEDMFVMGETNENGQRVVQLNTEFIRLPVRLPGKSFRARGSLLATKIGKYRLCPDYSTSERPEIQLFEEVHGAPILRPPDGWDDLGAGGADVQGRWAWGDEKKSSLETGIAARRPFFDAKQSIASKMVICGKLLFLFIVSWAGSLIGLHVSLAIPLFVGRFLYHLLRIPEKWIHDPMAFCIGFLLVFPVVRKTARLIVNDDTSLFDRFFLWLYRFNMPTRAKAVLLVQTFVLWFIVAPMLLGFLYEFTFIKSPVLVVGWSRPVISVQSLLLTWNLGTFFLYTWSDLCILGIFRKGFRPLEEPHLRRENNEGEEGELRDVASLWQGTNGRIGTFWYSLRLIVFNWEWDKVDDSVLNKNVAFPVTKQIFLCLMILTMPSFLLLKTWPSTSEYTALFISRLSLLVYGSFQMGWFWRRQILMWFEKAHKTARDDRFLVGEVLLNYGDKIKL